MSHGCNQFDITEELSITRATVNRDVHYINEMTNKGLFEMANVMTHTTEIQKECWRIYCNENNDPAITKWRKIAALRLAHEVQNHKFSIFQNDPATMERDL